MVEISVAGPFERFVLRGPGPFAVAIPTRPLRSVALDADGAALWLGPGEFLLLVADGEGDALARRVSASAGALSLVDVSHRSVSFFLSGDDAPLLLNGAVPLDLCEKAFPPGTCTRTICDKAEIVLWRRSEISWHVEVARSFAPYVRDLWDVIAQANGISVVGLY